VITVHPNSTTWHLTRVVAVALVVLTMAPTVSQAQWNRTTDFSDKPATGQSRETLEKIGFDQKLNGPIPLDTHFRDEDGRLIRLGDLFGKRPVLLAPVYYNCPLLCNQVVSAVARSLKPVSLDVGTDFDVVFVSIDPTEKPDLAKLKKRAAVELYDRPGTEGGWHFLTGEQVDITKLTDAVGFRYTYNARSRQFTHAAGITIVTPKGRLARYLFGIEYPPRDIQFSLVEASAGRIGSAVARIMLLCYDYDAAAGKYTLAIMRVTRWLGSLTVVLLAAFVLFLRRVERRRPVVHDPEVPAARSGSDASEPLS
jgi:protein SCO1/2